MHTLFNPENSFWNFIGKIADVACISILWFITSLPLITIGASTVAVYSFTLEAVQDTEGKIWSTYFSSFRKHFKKATVLWILHVIVFLFLFINLYAAWILYLNKGLIGLGLFSLSLCGMLIFLCTSLYIYPIVTYYNFSVKKVITDSFIMAVSNPHVTLTVLVIQILACVLIYYLSGFFFFWIGLAIFFSSYFIWGLFLKYAGVKIKKEKKKKKKNDPYL